LFLKPYDCNHPKPTQPHNPKPFQNDDLRIKYILETPDPRIHFALLRGCPVSVFDADNIELSLDQVTRHFVQNDVIYDSITKQIHISQLFKWYISDFGSEKNVLSFIVKFLSEDHPLKKEWMSSPSPPTEVAYHDKLWDSNGRFYENDQNPQ